MEADGLVELCRPCCRGDPEGLPKQHRVGGGLESQGAPGSAGIGRRLISGALTHVFVFG